MEPYSGYSPSAFFTTPTGLSPCIALLFSRLRVMKLGRTRVQTPHCLFLTKQLRFVLYRFQSPLLTASKDRRTEVRQSSFFLFRPVLKCFNFGRSPSSFTSIIKDVPLGHVWFNICMRFATPFPSLPGPSSPLEPSHPPNSVGASFKG